MTDANAAAAIGFRQKAEPYEQVMDRQSRRLAPSLIRFGGLLDDDGRIAEAQPWSDKLPTGCNTSSRKEISDVSL